MSNTQRPDLFPWAVAIVLFIIVGLLFIGGCANSVNGFGGFVQGVGQDLQDASAVQRGNSTQSLSARQAYVLGLQGKEIQ